MNYKLCVKKVVISAFAFALCAISFGQSKVEVKQVDGQKAAIIKVTTTFAAVSQKMGEVYGKLFSYLGTNNIQPAGPPFAIYYEFNPQGNVVFEAGVPVSASFKGTEEIVYKEYPSMKVVSYLYVGPYEKEGPVYEMLTKYVKDNNLQYTGVPWETYLTDPQQETDPNKYQTIIYFPLK